MYGGDAAGALDQAEKAIELDPLNPGLAILKGTALHYAGRLDEADLLIRSVVESDPAYENSYVPWADVLEARGLLNQAIEADLRAVAVANRASFTLCALARRYAVAGRRAEAESLLQELIDRYGRGEASAGEVAPVYAGLGENDLALEWLNKGFADHAPEMLAIKVVPEFRTLRPLPGFIDLLNRMHL
jgi:tetratricopeptide (TPR) repeat protein